MGQDDGAVILSVTPNLAMKNELCGVLNMMGVVNFTFLQVWSLATLVEKSYKLVDEETEAAFLAWTDGVVASIFRTGAAEDWGQELPVYRNDRL